VKNKRYLFSIAGILLLVIGLAVAFQNSLVVQCVSIKLIAGTREHRDRSFGKLGKEHELPDYRVKLNVHRRLSHIDLGTRLDVSAADWIDFPVSDRVYEKPEAVIAVSGGISIMLILDGPADSVAPWDENQSEMGSVLAHALFLLPSNSCLARNQSPILT